MKIAYMYATPDVIHDKVTAIRGDMAPVLNLIRETGYDGVELLVADPARIDRAELRRAVADSGLDLPAICTGEVYGQDKLSFADPAPEIRQQARDRMHAAMDLAAEYGAMVNIGRLRGRYVEGVARQQTEDWIAEAIRAALDRTPGVPILLEPVNHEYANCLMTTGAAVKFVRDLALDNLGLMLDAAHILIEGEDVAEACALAGDLFWHFHITDSDRLPVGDGMWDIAAIMAAVRASGFNRYTTVETFQIPDASHSIQASWQAWRASGA
ncbi:sugar phosphate isomerase/epimerase [Oceaniovalibus sp. ACAM 378]|uniref:sugar phosphate isomerase/epimerase family protein n=1 Tax=Oceaniovalibus sp. ACAM 378 TaxID=2599923 RepID=UPI0011D9AD0B|nr:sugar phosphate isomerase/epimerase family protein [Oceaniovalibus sp. ACAM 378]TYB87887.1 sugar phosphate isomerase/epimerase [Oceaniovalibus sp. ACAM 378]